jgi:hypothetical protein
VTHRRRYHPGAQHGTNGGQRNIGQTHLPIEVLAIDNGSTDGTAEVVAGIRDPIVLTPSAGLT